MGNTLDLSSYPNGLSDAEKSSVDDLLINITNANTEALASAVDNMQFNNIDQVRWNHQKRGRFWEIEKSVLTKFSRWGRVYF